MNKTLQKACLAIVASGLLMSQFAYAQNMAIATNFIRPGWCKQGDYFKANQNWGTIGSGTNWKTADPWNPTFISEVGIYRIFRFMDAQITNGSTHINWSDRHKATDNHNTAGYIALEWCINLCNKMDRDIWVCVPHQASDDYIWQMANFLKTHLEWDRKIFIEYSNETWNLATPFTQSKWCIEKGKAGNYPGANEWYKGEAFSLHRALQVFGIFENVFGSGNVGRWAKVRRVVCHGGNLDLTRQALKTVYKSTTYNPNNRKIDLLALAPYTGGGIDGAASDVATKFRAETDRVYNNRVLYADQTRVDNGISTLTTYEAGQHITTNADKWSANPKIYDEYRYMMSKLKPKIAHFVHFGHNMPANSGGAWGAKTYVGQPLTEAHKYRALKDWQAANPAREDGEEESQSAIFSDNGLSIYPNPTTGILNVVITGDDAKIKVFSSLGSTIVSTQTYEGEARIDLSRNSSGIYFIEITTLSDRIIKKVVLNQ